MDVYKLLSKIFNATDLMHDKAVIKHLLKELKIFDSLNLGR